VILRLDTSGTRTRVKIAPPARPASLRPASASIVVNYLAAGASNGYDTCEEWPTDARTAFEYAESIWEGLINSPVPITINACWYYESSSTLGYNFVGDSSHDFGGVPATGTWYAPALANALHGSDLMPGQADTNIAINRNFGWYTGTDGNPGSSEVDMVSVVLHEIAHGLGFSGSMWHGTGCGGVNYGCWGAEGYPDIYDRFTENAAGQFLISAYTNPSAALGSALTSNNLWFDGTYAKAANGGQKVKIYAPSVWSPGSSYAHLDYDTFKNTDHRLMVYAFDSGSAIHSPGAITLGILRDIGWRSAPDVQIIKQLVGPAEPQPGDWITFTLSISNVGSLPATSVVVTDIIPSQVLTPTFASTLNITRTGVVSYVWNVGSLAVGQGGVITVYGRIDPGLPPESSFANNASISDPQDFVTSNNASSAQVGGYRVYLPIVMLGWPPLQTVYLMVGSDTTILQGSPGTNFGSATDMWVGYDHCYGGQVSRSLLWFDVSAIPSSASISEAKLYLDLANSCDIGERTHVATAYRISNDWLWSSVTWNNRPSYSEAYGSVSIPSWHWGWYSLDVTNLVRGWVNGSLSNYGLMVRGPESSGNDSAQLGFYTGNAGSSVAPYLMVKYYAATGAMQEQKVTGEQTLDMAGCGTTVQEMLGVSGAPERDMYEVVQSARCPR
jgi:uncharacterized repeat protein (TIGR01451 family)